MTFTPFQDDESIQSSQGEVGFDPLPVANVGDTFYQGFQQAESRRDLFNQSRQEQREIVQLNQQTATQNLTNSYDAYKPLLDFLPKVKEQALKQVDKYIENQKQQGRLNVLQGKYDARQAGEPQDPAEVEKLNTAQQQSQAGNQVYFQAEEEAAAAGNFDVARTVRGKNPYYAEGMAMGYLDRYNSTYEADISAAMLDPKYAKMEGKMGREAALAEVRREKFKEIEWINPELVDAKVITNMVSADSRVLTKMVRQDNINTGKTTRNNLTADFASGKIRDYATFVEQYALTSNAQGTGVIGRAEAIKAFKQMATTTPFQSDRELDQVLGGIDPRTGQPLREARPDLARAITVAQDQMDQQDYSLDKNNRQIAFSQAKDVFIQQALRDGINDENLEEAINTFREKYGADVVGANPFPELTSQTFEAQTKADTKEDDARERDRLDELKVQGLLTRDDVLNSSLSNGAKASYLQSGGFASAEQSAKMTDLDKKARTALSQTLKEGILKVAPGTSDVNGIGELMTRRAMDYYQAAKATFMEGGVPADKASTRALRDTLKWMKEEGAGIQGREQNPDGIFAGPKGQVGTFNIMSEYGSPQELASAAKGVEQARLMTSAAKALGGNWWTKLQPDGTGVIMARSEAEAMRDNLANGGQLEITPKLQTAARISGQDPLTLINGQLKAFGMEPIESPLQQQIQQGGIDGSSTAERLVRQYPSGNRSSRALGTTTPPNTFNAAAVPTLNGMPMAPVIEQAAAENNLPPSIVAGVIDWENRGGNNAQVAWQRGQNAQSPAGARGVAQFMPGTARQFGVDVNDPVSSIKGAARYLRHLMDNYGFDLETAIYAYNAGPGTIQDYGPGATKENKDYLPGVLCSAYKYGYTGSLLSPNMCRGAFAEAAGK